MPLNQSRHGQSLCYERGLCDSFFNVPSSLALRENQEKGKQKSKNGRRGRRPMFPGARPRGKKPCSPIVISLPKLVLMLLLRTVEGRHIRSSLSSTKTTAERISSLPGSVRNSLALLILQTNCLWSSDTIKLTFGVA